MWAVPPLWLGNSERQLYTNENHNCKRKPVITAKKEEGKHTLYSNHDQREKEFQYGYFEAKAKLPVECIWPIFLDVSLILIK
jgi:hypothetical protein